MKTRTLEALWCEGTRAAGLLFFLLFFLTWPPYSCSDPGALCWVCTSRRPPGSFCSSSERFCCRPAASRWSLWTAPGGRRRRRQDVNGLSHLRKLHRGVSFTKTCHKPTVSLALLQNVQRTFKTLGILSQFSCTIATSGAPSSR